MSVYLLIKNNHISVIKRKVSYKHYVKNYSTRPDIRQWSVITSVLQNLDIFGTRISKYTVKQITGPKVASLLPQAQYSWGYHRLYAAIHPSEMLQTLNSMKSKYPRNRKINENIMINTRKFFCHTPRCWGKAHRPKSEILMLPLRSIRTFSGCNM